MDDVELGALSSAVVHQTEQIPATPDDTAPPELVSPSSHTSVAQPPSSDPVVSRPTQGPHLDPTDSVTEGSTISIAINTDRDYDPNTMPEAAMEEDPQDMPPMEVPTFFQRLTNATVYIFESTVNILEFAGNICVSVLGIEGDYQYVINAAERMEQDAAERNPALPNN